MKIDFAMLDILVEAGAPAKAIVEYLRAQDAKKAPKREREKVRSKATRDNKRQREATIGNSEQQEATPEQRYYASGKTILGKNAGGLLSSLLRHNNYDIPTAQRIVDEAATKQDAREWVSASMRGNNGTLKGEPRRGSRDDTRERLVRALDQLDEFAEGGPQSHGPPDGGEVGSATVSWLPKSQRS